MKWQVTLLTHIYEVEANEAYQARVSGAKLFKEENPNHLCSNYSITTLVSLCRVRRLLDRRVKYG